MSRFPILFVCTLLLACSGTFPSGTTQYESPQSTAAVVTGAEEPTDLGLTLYRDPRSRGEVQKFYAGVAGDDELGRIILLQASAYDIPLPLAFALAWGESQFNPRAFNRNPQSVDRGLFQLNSRTFPHLKTDDFYDPRINAHLGMRHLRFCLNAGQNELVGLAIYNAGSLKVRGRGTPYNTLHHIAKILDYRQKLEEEFTRALLKHPGMVSVL